MNHERRLQALERQIIRRFATEAGALYRLSAADELRTQAGFSDADLAHVREILTRHNRPMD